MTDFGQNSKNWFLFLLLLLLFFFFVSICLLHICVCTFSFIFLSFPQQSFKNCFFWIFFFLLFAYLLTCFSCVTFIYFLWCTLLKTSIGNKRTGRKYGLWGYRKKNIYIWSSKIKMENCIFANDLLKSFEWLRIAVVSFVAKKKKEQKQNTKLLQY